MEDTLVSARISRAKKETAAAMLHKMGSSASELINCAYDYVIASGKLPQVKQEQTRAQEDFARFLHTSTLDIDWGNAIPDGDYRAFMKQERLADYESLG